MKNLKELCESLNKSELNSKMAERDSVKWKQVEFMSKNIGNEYDAVITGVKEWGIYAEATDNGCEGCIRKESLYNMGYLIDEDTHSIKSDDNIYRLASTIRIRVVDVDITNKNIDYELVNEKEEEC